MTAMLAVVLTGLLLIACQDLLFVYGLPLLLPVFGRWQVYQGFDGEHTPRPPWQHALDFYITEDGKSCSGQGEALEDYYCFGLPVLSPVHGQVVR
jgi:hypothetical protein